MHGRHRPAASRGTATEPDCAAAARQGQRRRGREGRPILNVSCANIETKNIAWKLPLPAYSGSTPIIWGETIFLNVATGHQHRRARAVGDRSQQAGGDCGSGRSPTANHMERKQNMSSPSPVTDGKYVWVMTGVGILKAFDFAGKEIWSRNIQSRLRRSSA